MKYTNYPIILGLPSVNSFPTQHQDITTESEEGKMSTL